MKLNPLLFGIPAVILASFVLANQKENISQNPADKLSQPEDTQQSQDKKANSSITSSRAQLLYEHHCMKCHESNVHIRKTKKAKNINEVRGWVTKWQAHEKLNWDKDAINSVTRYLAQEYYKFK